MAQIVSVFLLGHLVRVPGLRSDLPLAWQSLHTWTFAAFPWQPLSVLSVCMVPLVLVRALVAISRPEHTEEAEARLFALRGFLVYMFLVLAIAMTATWELEHALHDGLSAASSPGFVFRSRAVAAFVGCAALVWEFANQLTRSGIGRGPLVLFGIAAGVRGVLDVGQLMVSVARVGDVMSAPLGWAMAALLVPTCLVLVAFTRYSLGNFPVTVMRGAELSSPLGMVLAPWIVVGLTDNATLSVAEAVGLSYEGLQGVRLVIGLLVAMGVIWWLRAYSVGAGDRSWALGAVLVLALPVPVMAGISFSVYEEGPFHGHRAYDVYVRPVTAAGPDDVGAFERRLEELRVVAEVETLRDGRVRFGLAGVSDATTVMQAVLAPHDVAIHVAGDQRVLLRDRYVLADADLIVIGGRPKGRSFDLRRYLAGVHVPLEAGTVALDCGGRSAADPDTVCTAVLVEQPPILTRADVASAAVGRDDEGRPFLRLTLTDEGDRQLCWVTGHHVGSVLVVSADDEVLSVPEVAEAMCGGYVDVAMGWESSVAEAQRRAATLTAALRAPPVRGRWVVESAWPVLSVESTPPRGR